MGNLSPKSKMASLKPSQTPQQTVIATGVGNTDVPDVLASGLGSSLAGSIRPPHPVEAIENNTAAQQAALSKHALDATYGTHAFLRTQLDTAVMSSYHRLPGISSEFLALDTLSGADETIEFADYLGAPRDPIDAVDFRAQAEALYGIRMPSER